MTHVAFEEDPPRGEAPDNHPADTLLLDIDGYEGPIDVLLQLARDQKVDLSKISILQLARQYLDFVERAKELRLDLAADYLVMAAWLAYLKSRLLLPKQESDEEQLSAQEMAEALQFQLRRLEAMQAMAEKLMKRPQLGRQVFARGMPEKLHTQTETVYDVALVDILRAYGDIQRRASGKTYDLPKFTLMSMESAMQRMTKMLGALPRKGQRSVWTTLHSFLPEGIRDGLFVRSALASMFTAGLELVKQGKLEIRQDGPFRPIYMRTNTGELEESYDEV